MASIFAALPALAGNGPGPAVDVSGFGGIKTLINAGNGQVIEGFEPIVTVEISNDPTALVWAPLVTFNGPDQQTLMVSCRWMRVVVANYKQGGSPLVSVGSEGETVTFLTLAAPAGNGSGAGASSAALGALKTIQVGGVFRGVVNIEASEDGLTGWQTVMSFPSAGQQSYEFVANSLRVTRTGVPGVGPGVPVVYVAATTGSTGGGGGGGSIVIQDEGVPLAGAPHTTLNFTGAVAATDAGGGVATVFVPGITFQDEGAPIAGAPHVIANFTGAGVTVSNAGGGVSTINVPGGIAGINTFDEGVATPNNPHSGINFIGSGVTASDAGGGVTAVTIPGGIAGIGTFDEGVPVVATSTAINFIGAGVTATNGGGGVTNVTVPGSSGGVVAMALPEQWCQNDVAASQTNVALSAQVSTNFDDIKVIRAGSIVGMSTRLTEAITTGTLTVQATINGVGVGVSIVHTSGGNASGGVVTIAVGTVPYAASNLIGIRLTTDGTFAPTTTDLEAWLEVVE